MYSPENISKIPKVRWSRDGAHARFGNDRLNVMLGGEIQTRITRIAERLSDEEIAAQFENPIFILSAPRAGSTLLFQLLACSPDIWTIGAESHGIYAQFPHLPGPRNLFGDGRLYAEHAEETVASRMRLYYLALLRNAARDPLSEGFLKGNERFVFLEKTPRNSLNISFLLRIFPKARFIFLWRDAKANIASLIEAWQVGAQSRQFVTYRNLPDWPLGYWCFLLPPGWEALKGKSLAEIAAFQWRACNDIVLDDLSQISRERWAVLSYDDLIGDPGATLTQLCDFCGVSPGDYLSERAAGNLPLSTSTLSPPRADKWRAHEGQISAVLPSIQGTINRLADL